MLPRLTHRGPDGSGVWADAGAEIALGHRRLAILDLSTAGAQPMRSGCGRFAVTYNGEIYNFRELRSCLRTRNFRGNSDTEVLLESAAELGVEQATIAANGMFAFAVWDNRARELWLARDRIGIKPLYWTIDSDRFIFASDLGAMRPMLRHGGDVDPAGLALFLRYGYIPGTATIYRGVHKVAPGHLLRIQRRDGRLVVEDRTYWSVFDHVSDPEQGSRGGSSRADDHEQIERLEALLSDAVRSCMVSDVPLGAFLSGGVDSSTVVSLMGEWAPQGVQTFSIGFSDARFDEAPFASRVAKALRTEHYEHYVSPSEALAVIPTLGSVYNEPFADASQIPTILVSQLARRNVTVALSGDGGDELFGGYSHYSKLDRMWAASEVFPRHLRRSVGAGVQRLSQSARYSTLLRRAAARPALRRRLVHAELLGSFFAESAGGVEALYEAFLDHWRGESVVKDAQNLPMPQVLDSSTRTKDPRTQMMLRDLLVYLPEDILTKVDRATMSCGLEARVPLLDHRVVEFALSLPSRMRFRDAQSKWALRQVLYRRVPRQLIDRPKMGFSMPLATWLRGPLRDWADSLLSPARLRDDGYFAPELVERTWTEHTSGVQDWSTQLWDVLMFQSWLEAARQRPTAERESAGRALLESGARDVAERTRGWNR